jgi:MSHA biogenesis protein MshI
MFGWLKGVGATPGCVAVSFDEAALRFAEARRQRSAKAHISSYGARELTDPRALERTRREFGLGRAACSTMLRTGDYDIVLLEAPNVARSEMKSALRWKVKDRIDYPIEEATIDFLQIPAEEGAAAAGRNPQVYVIVTRNEVIRARVEQFQAAGIPLAVIEIPETAQRNIATLYEEGDRGVALAYFAEDSGLLTISHGGELYLSRRLEIGLDELATDTEAAEGGPQDRVVLEIQRTLDHFERQFRHVAVGKLLIAPSGRTIGLREVLQERFEMPVRQIDLVEVLTFGGRSPEERLQWRLFHHFGAALREGSA